MWGFISSLLFLYILIAHEKGVNGPPSPDLLSSPEMRYHRIQIESHSRDYKSGPVGGTYTLSVHDQILLSVEPAKEGHIWQWVMTTKEPGKYCQLSRVYERGASVSMKCANDEGTYTAFALHIAVSEVSDKIKASLEEFLDSPSSMMPSEDDIHPKSVDTCLEGQSCIEGFQIQWEEHRELLEKTFGSIERNPQLIQSFPIKIIASEYCFIWAYQMEEIEKVGYVHTEAEPFDSDGSFISYRIRVWVAEANAMSEAELDHDFPQAEYSSVLTRRFRTKGLEPCFRFSHQAIELVSPEPKYFYEVDGEGVFWMIDFKVHTSTIVSSLSDISVTIGSRQHIALYGCFIAETRVLLDPRQFAFLGTQRNDIQKINIEHSEMPLVMKRFMKKWEHVFGHYVRFLGHPWDYESTHQRRDMQIFSNPCMTLEFGFAVRGVSYMAQNWLSLGMDDVSQISLPGFEDDDFDLTEGIETGEIQIPEQDKDFVKHIKTQRTKYVDAYDFVYTPTHLVILSAESHIILYPTSVIYKGFGVIRNAQSYRAGALVQRRWCATTGTPKEHNMIVPAYSANGNFIIVQILPIGKTTTMWLQSPSHACLRPQIRTPQTNTHLKNASDSVKTTHHDTLYIQKMEEQNRLEFCIHRKEISKSRSKIDEENQLITEDSDEAKKYDCYGIKGLHEEAQENVTSPAPDSKVDLDSRLKFWYSGQTLLTEQDPHFVKEQVDDPGKFKMDPNEDASNSNFNRYILYEVDKKGSKIKETFHENGLTLNSEETLSETKEHYWLHDVEFTAMERRFMQAIEFKSDVLKKTEFSMAIINVITLDEPVKLVHKKYKVDLETDYLFSGVLIVKPNLKKDEGQGDKGKGKDGRMEGSVKTFTTNTALSSYVIHIDYLNDPEAQDVLIYARFDGTHARPLSYFSDKATMIRINSENDNKKGNDKDKEVHVRFTGRHPALATKVLNDNSEKNVDLLKPDLIMTQHGIVSVLWRKAKLLDSEKKPGKPSGEPEPRDNYPQAAIIGSIIVPEPLRLVMPFKGSSNIFQRATADGEIIYGDYSLENWKKNKDGKMGFKETQNETEPQSTSKVLEEEPPDFIPNLIDIKTTRFLSVPFESLVAGSSEATREPPEQEMKINSDDPTVVVDRKTDELESSGGGGICPYADFVVHFLPFDFAEVEYRTRITAELVFLGSNLPVEADILVEFDDQHGISVVIHSGAEENRFQTLIRKTIDIHTFLTPAALNRMYLYPDEHDDTDEIKEEMAIFSLTMRPSILNLHCPKHLFFKTIQINVGCNPFTTMRFIPEAIGLQKIKFLRSKNYKDRESSWTVTKQSKKNKDNGQDEEEVYEITVPRGMINFSQKKQLECVSKSSDKRGYCKIPTKYTKLFKENIYSIHFSKRVVPKFEQFLTRHVRRVTGNIFLYKILGGDTWEMNTNTSLLDSKCHNLAPSCAPLDKTCVSNVNASVSDSNIANKTVVPWTSSFLKKVPELDLHTDVYRHFRDCYVPARMTADQDMVQIHRDLPSRMHKERYWLFNTTNYNAFKFEKHRNMIFLIRAVVVNTPENGFTYCQRLETFFLLQMTGVAPARRPLPWHFYLALITFVLFIFVVIYFYYAHSSKWRSEISTRRIREEELKEQREVQAKQFYEQQKSKWSQRKLSGPHNYENDETLAKWAARLRDISQDKERDKELADNEQGPKIVEKR